MSFGSDIKEELYARVPEARHCQIALLLSLQRFADTADARAAALIGRLDERLGHVYPRFEPSVIFNDCCRRVYLRGVFLAAGMIGDPQKSYDLEFSFEQEEDAAFVLGLLKESALSPKLTRRKQQYVVYIKDGDGVVEFLGMIEAHRALLDMENVRIVKELRGNVNRRVNCETANLSKVIDASVRQQDAIRALSDSGRLAQLPAGLQEIARLRLDYPEASLEELGAMLDPPVGKSGVNHRLRRLVAEADRGVQK